LEFIELFLTVCFIEKFWLKPFSKGLSEPPRTAVAIRRWRKSFDF
jgi:hypothetical protein